jgi:hypothetical protein
LENDYANNALLTHVREKLASIPGLELSGDGIHSRVIDFLINTVAKLSMENSILKKELAMAEEVKRFHAKDKIESEQQANESSENPVSSETQVYETYHVVYCDGGKKNYFRDVPRMFKGDLKSDHLRGLVGVVNMSKYLENQPHVVFVVVRQYNCSCGKGLDYHRIMGYKDGKLIKDSPPAESKENHVIFGNLIHTAMKCIIKTHPDCFKGYSAENLPKWIQEPYLLFYAHNKTFLELAKSGGLDDSDFERVKLLTTWLEDNWRKDWDEADELLSRNKINAKHYKKLFRPNELVLNPRKHKQGLLWV